ncbi:MAG: heme NO-binding domain-containing protein [Bacteroidota bacterium]
MYGIVNDAIKGLVVENYGENTWEKVKSESKVEVDFFLNHESYPDKITYDLAIAASKVLDTPLDQILIAFGEYWVLVTAKQKYGHLVEAGGYTLKDFLHYLPNLHDRVMLQFPNLRPPEFRISDTTDKSLHLHYISERPGLQDFVRGLISGLGKLFETDVEVALILERAAGDPHEVFAVSW